MSQDGSHSTSLLHRALAREPDAWNRLLIMYSPLVKHWCRQAGVSYQDIPDISQDIFATVSTRLATFRPDQPGTTFRAWMRGVARLKLLEHFRNRGLPGVGGTSTWKRLEQVAAPPEQLEYSEGSGELTRLCQRALKMVRHEFEDRTWTAFWRVAVEEQATADVASEMGITSSAIRQAKSRVLRRLREEIGELTV
jgi:RNA polymerase sigma-70 factor (ECF subfamily)